MGKVPFSGKFAYISGGLLLFITGIYMAAEKWGWKAWIIVSFVLWLFLVVHGSSAIGGKVKKFGQFLNSSSNISKQDLNAHAHKMKLMNLLQSRLAVALGAVFIMTVKPALVGSIIVVIVAVILGILPMFFKKNPSSPKLAEADQKN